MNISKTQIDKLGDRLRNAPLSDSDLRELDAYRRSFGDIYESTVSTIQQRLHLEPTGRPAKSTSSIIEKLQRESIRLSQIQDIAGCRLVVDDIVEQDRIIEKCRKIFPEAFIMDRRKKPSYGYRAVHLIIKTADKSIEIQVRSTLQHLWAEFSEKLSDTDKMIKYGDGAVESQKMLLDTSKLIESFEQNELALDEFKKDPGEITSSDLDHLVIGKESIKKELSNMLRKYISNTEKRKK